MRSRARWIKEGKKPTRYFFRLEQERIEKNRVVSMCDYYGGCTWIFTLSCFVKNLFRRLVNNIYLRN